MAVAVPGSQLEAFYFFAKRFSNIKKKLNSYILMLTLLIY